MVLLILGFRKFPEGLFFYESAVVLLILGFRKFPEGLIAMNPQCFFSPAFPQVSRRLKIDMNPLWSFLFLGSVNFPRALNCYILDFRKFPESLKLLCVRCVFAWFP